MVIYSTCSFASSEKAMMFFAAYSETCRVPDLPYLPFVNYLIVDLALAVI